MRRTTTLLALPFLLAATGCELFSSDEDTSVRITIEQALTGETTSEGTFTLTGAIGDAGTTNETLTFGGPLDQPVVPVTFTRTLTGAHGTITVTGAATITFSSPTAGTLAGTWTVQSGTGRYANMTGNGRLSGAANFGALPPTATLEYSGEVKR